MSRTMASIAYGREAIVFDVLRVKRKTLEIAVHPDQSVVVKAPIGSDSEEVLRRVRRRAGWIRRQILYFEQFEPRTPPRRHVSGESHLYLGRNYRLKIRKSHVRQVSLKNGSFYIQSPTSSPNHVQTLLDEWYWRKASICFSAVFHLCWERFKTHGVAMPDLKIRKMKTRWGSLSTGGRLTLNLDLIKAPKGCIEYVVIHEFCHLFYRNHDADFYKLLHRSLPDWVQRKHKLETALV